MLSTFNGTYSAALTAADGVSGDCDYTATFSELVMASGGSSLFDFVIASSPLDYTGGSFKGELTGGNIVGHLKSNGLLRLLRLM